jgi:hypothetical protein
MQADGEWSLSVKGGTVRIGGEALADFLPISRDYEMCERAVW